MKQNILFCGTPKFATTSLQAVFKCQDELNYNLKGVVTIPDKKAGRGQKKQESEIKKEAKKLNLNIFEPNKLTDNDFIQKIKQLNLDLIIVVAFKKLPQQLFTIPKQGTINLHASLLPKYRGAAPINWAIINGENETGLTTFFINQKIDTGDIILQSKTKISKECTAGELHDILMKKSPDIIKKTIKIIFSKKYKLKHQHTLQFSLAPKIQKKDRILNIYKFYFNKSNTFNKLYNFIRGMSPPGVKTNIIIEYQNKDVIKKTIIIKDVNKTIFNNKKIASKTKSNKVPILKISNKNLLIQSDAEAILIKKIKVENGKEMSSEEFINGFLQKCTKIKFENTKEINVL